MKVKVRGIPQDGIHVEESVEPAEIGITDEEITCLAPLVIAADVERVGNIVVAAAEVKIRVSFSCSRCMEEVERESSENYKFEYEVNDKTEFIDLGEDIRQEMIMNLPLRILCREDCKGICLHCGANLNEEDCSCGK